jgi:dual specificity MAP kinase phosphatase
MGFFASPRLPPTVNLRLFRQQPSRYATISDIVVYSEAGMSDDAIALAQLIRIAQDQCFHSRGGRAADAIEYNVYIVSEPFEVFERDFSHVVAVDGWGYRRNKIDFFEREREEMAALTRASEIANNVWVSRPFLTIIETYSRFFVHSDIPCLRPAW